MKGDRTSVIGRIRNSRAPFMLGLFVIDFVAIILLSLFNFRIFYLESWSLYRTSLISYEESVTNMAFMNIDRQISQIADIPRRYFADITQNTVSLRPQTESIMENSAGIRELTDIFYMIQTSNPYLYSMDVYYEGTGNVITGFSRLHDMTGQDKVGFYLPWMESEFYDGSSSCFIPLGANSYPTNQEVITYVRKVASPTWDGDSIYVALHLDPKIITDFITEDSARSFCLYDARGVLIYGDGDEPASNGKAVFSLFQNGTGLGYSYSVDYNLYFDQQSLDQKNRIMLLYLLSIILNVVVLSGLTALNYVLYGLHIKKFSENVGIPVTGSGVDASLHSMRAQIKNLSQNAESARKFRQGSLVRRLVLGQDNADSYSRLPDAFPGRYVRCFVIESDSREGDLMANMLQEQFSAESLNHAAGVFCTFINPSNVVALVVVDENLAMLDEISERIITLSDGLPVNIGKLHPLDEDGLHESYLSASLVSRYRFVFDSTVLSYDELDIDGRKPGGNHTKQLEQLGYDLNMKQADVFSSHLASLVQDLKGSDYTVQYCLSVIDDLTMRVNGYMLRNQLDSRSILGYDIRTFSKQLGNIDAYVEWMESVISVVYESIRYRDMAIDSDVKQRIEMIINEEIENDISLTLIADRLNMKTYELSRMFSKIMGKNYIDYIKEKKLERGVEMLRENVAVQDIAARLGYRSAQYFIKLFKEVYGTTPYQYKKTVLVSQDE